MLPFQQICVGIWEVQTIVKTSVYANHGWALQLAPVKDPTDSTACPSGTTDAACLPQGPSKAGITNGVYPMSRKLYVESIVGVSAIIDPNGGGFTSRAGAAITPRPAAQSRFVNEGLGSEQAQLIQCLLTEQAPLETALSATGFFPISLTSSAPVLDPITLTCN